MAKIFERKAVTHRSYRFGSSNPVATPAYTMAVVMSSNEVKRIATEINQQGGKIIFSYEHLLMDQAGQGPVFDAANSKNAYQSKVFTVKPGSIVKDISQWEYISFSYSSKTRSSSENSQTLTLEVDKTVGQNLMDQTIAFLADMDGAIITENENENTAEIVAGDANIKVEFDPNEPSTAQIVNGETRFIKKLWKKAVKVVNNYIDQFKKDFKELPSYIQYGFIGFAAGVTVCALLSGPCAVEIARQGIFFIITIAF